MLYVVKEVPLMAFEPRSRSARAALQSGSGVDTPIEAAYFSAGGILPYVLGQSLAHGGREEGMQ